MGLNSLQVLSVAIYFVSYGFLPKSRFYTVWDEVLQASFVGRLASNNAGNKSFFKNKDELFMRKNSTHIHRIIILTFIYLSLNSPAVFAQTICIEPGTSDQRTGLEDGYRYELWNQNAQGKACMTLGEGALFSGEWDGIYNYLARRGLGYDQTQEHDEFGRFYATYDCIYEPIAATGNSYLSVYGWTVEPLIEYYIVEDWRNWIPSMAGSVVSRGSFTANGSTYDVYENTRTNQPSIVGTATFQQYFSIRRNERNSGTINITDHFEYWESQGMELGKLHEVSFVVEGFESSGSFEFKKLEIFATTEAITGTKGKEIANSFSVYPNPSNGSLFIQLDKPFAKSNVEVYDILGKLVFSKEKVQDNQIQLSGLTSGIYFIKVREGRNVHQAKFLLQ